jgi:DNA-nicking Smr family endonuclease
MFSKLKKLFKGAQLPEHKPEPEKPVKDQDNRTAAPLITETNNQEIAPLMDKTVEISPDHRPLPVLKRNRKGIRVIDKHKSIHDLFSVEDIGSDSPTVIQPDPVTTEITSKKNEIKRSIRSVTRTTRNGFPILDDMDDFSLFMARQSCDADRTVDQIKPSDSQPVDGQKEKRASLMNKHGIPMLSENDNSTEIEKNEFLRLLNDSLGGKTRDVLMNEKGVRTFRRKPLSLKEKVKRYPLPQSQLDLHGYTAIKAELRSESFLKNAYGNQMHTVIIIVGKGLHSDEGAVLPDVVEMLLVRLRKEGIVLFYEWENEKKSRSGSVTVYLNNMVFD